MQSASLAAILLVDDEVLVRTSIAEYLRHCGYRVIEAVNAAEAIIVLSNPDLPIDVVLSAVEMREGMDGFGLAHWMREHLPGIEVILAATPARASAAAADLCDRGPMLARPYDPQLVHDRIKRVLAGRKPPAVKD